MSLDSVASFEFTETATAPIDVARIVVSISCECVDEVKYAVLPLLNVPCKPNNDPDCPESSFKNCRSLDLAVVTNHLYQIVVVDREQLAETLWLVVQALDTFAKADVSILYVVFRPSIERWEISLDNVGDIIRYKAHKAAEKQMKERLFTHMVVSNHTTLPGFGPCHYEAIDREFTAKSLSKHAEFAVSETATIDYTFF